MKNQTSISKATEAHQSNLQLQRDQHPLVDDQTFPSMEAYVSQLIHRKAYEEVARLVAGKTVLDVGCNVGYGLQVLASSAASIAGIDVSPKAVESAKRRLGSTADIRAYDGVRCSFESGSFDVVTSFQVLEHVSDTPAYFSEIIRLVRPGGIVVFTTPNARLRLDPGMKPWNQFHVREYTPAELKELLSARFDAVEVRGLFGNEELYEMERNRCERARAAARARPAGLRLAFRKTMKRALPWLASARNAWRVRARIAKEKERLAPAELNRFSTRDLFYKDDPLDDALDLMAICRGARKPSAFGSRQQQVEV